MIVPIPGARRETHLGENRAASNIVLSSEELSAVGAVIPGCAVTGKRYSDQEMAMVRL